MELQNLIIRDPEIMGGTPVFAGTRVPIDAFFDFLKAGASLEEFLDDFPTVERGQATDLLELLRKYLKKSVVPLGAQALRERVART